MDKLGGEENDGVVMLDSCQDIVDVQKQLEGIGVRRVRGRCPG